MRYPANPDSNRVYETTAMDRHQFDKESRRLLAARDFRSLVRLCQRMRQGDPRCPDAWFLESVAAEAGRNPAAAVRLVDKALELAPRHVEYWVQKARYLAQLHALDASIAAAERALALGVVAPGHKDTLGVVLTRAGRYQQALGLLREAVASQPNNPQWQFNLAAAEQFAGTNERAREHFERVLALAPGHARSYWALSELEKEQVSDRHEVAMRALAERSDLSDTDALYLAHALARLEESRGDYQAAVARLSRAKARRRTQLGYDFKDDRALFDTLKRRFSGPLDVQPSGAMPAPSNHPRPLFIVGLPRTGTTLLERIVSAHADVGTLGELQELPIALKKLSATQGEKVLSPEVVEALLAMAPAPDVEAAYRASIATRLADLHPPPRYVIDKNPLNFFFIGLVAKWMPDARFLLMRRHPIDAALSNFRQLFALEYSYYNYSYDLGDLGRYVMQFEHLADHWQALLGDRLKTVQYEALVEDPRSVIEGVLHYLDLPWDEACLHFHRQATPVATPSGSQVRQPLYNTAVGRWQRYGDALAPLLTAMAEEGYVG